MVNFFIFFLYHSFGRFQDFKKFLLSIQFDCSYFNSFRHVSCFDHFSYFIYISYFGYLIYFDHQDKERGSRASETERLTKNLRE